MKYLKYTILIVLGKLCLIGCQKQNNQEIADELQIHFSNFESEAIAHGLSINISEIDIDGYIQNIETIGTLGQCKSFSDGSNQVIIDRQYWNRISYIEKEYIVFHELGHCLLDRAHDDNKDENGNCISIMQSGSNECKSDYNDENKPHLLLELFSN